MTARLVLVPSADLAPPAQRDQVVLVMDTSWRPDGTARTDLVPMAPAVQRVLAARDPFSDARVLLDDWAAAVDLDGASTIQDFAWWYRYRLATWLTLTRCLHWRAILDEVLDEVGPVGAIAVPADERTLPRVAELLAEREDIPIELTRARAGRTAPPEIGVPSVWQRMRRRAVPRSLPATSPATTVAELRRRRELVHHRVAQLRTSGRGRLVALVAPQVSQRADLAGGERVVDPFLEAVVEACGGSRLDPVLLSVGPGVEDDALWSAVQADERLLPESDVVAMWATDGDAEAAAQDAARCTAAIDSLPPVPLDDGGVDLGVVVRRRLVRFTRASLPRNLLVARRAAQMLRDLDSCGVLLYSEYVRRDHVAAARAAGVPSFAVQHGIIYPGHVGYVQRRTPAVQLPTCTFVYGSYEARVMREHGGYREDEVRVTGSPRLALLAGGDPGVPLEPAVRSAVRQRLGVAPGDRLLVVSTTHEQMHRQFYWATSLSQLLCGALPGVHLVFKQHPSETDDGGYADLVGSIARRAGVQPPPVTVVRDIDLYTLLRSADAHLGLFSTVLTDAVAAGTPNLVATTQARQDLLGYVAAEVAVPVSSHADLVAALRTCTPPAPAARARFLAEHMESGDAPGRIRDAMLAATASRWSHETA